MTPENNTSAKAQGISPVDKHEVLVGILSAIAGSAAVYPIPKPIGSHRRVWTL
jgi:hypothetical protein